MTATLPPAPAPDRPILSLFEAEPDRLDRMVLEAGGLVFDFARAQLAGAELEGLLAHAAHIGLEARRAALFAGEPVNATEHRAVLHMALRDPVRDWQAAGEPVSAGVREVQARATAFAHAVRDGTVRTARGETFEAIVHLGIGGSDLGPRLIQEALEPWGGGQLALRFAANVEPGELSAALAGLDPARTLVVCVSKTFTTLETLTNLAATRAWLQAAIGPDDSAHLVAVSAAPAKAVAAGFLAERVFGFEAWVGGRFSLWSAVGLSNEIALGPVVMAQLRAGAAAMDRLFETASLARNPAVVAGLLGYWNRSVLGLTTRAVIPYARRLRLLPAFLQQLEMESNGKGIGLDGQPVASSGPVVWGAEGTNAQHAFFQHLHQSPDATPVEFIALASDNEGAPERTRLTLANSLAQAEALLTGRTLMAVEAEMARAGADAATIAAVAPHRVFSGNRPSSYVLMDALSPQTLGAYLAFCEHRVFVEGTLWGINSFDQWGVELGKTIATEIARDLADGPSDGRDPATAAMINRLRRRG
jgi:glucose-6-phosphate isomerase